MKSTKKWFSENINKIHKLSVRPTKNNERTQITRVRIERRDITTRPKEVKRTTNTLYCCMPTN